jgi:protein SCO1/2
MWSAGCKPSPGDSVAPPVTEGSITNYPARGIVQAVHPDRRLVVIKHEEVVGYMPAMTMPFEVRDTNELRGLAPGATVEFRLRVAEKEGWIDQVRSAAAESTQARRATNAGSAIHLLPDVPVLKVGDLLPDYGFTNQFGRAFTFIVPRCPFPNFCPRMTDNLAQAQRLLKATPDAPTHWRLLSLTIDPEFDTPEVLGAYGRRFKGDPDRWWLASGDYDSIERLAGHFGQYFARGATVAGQNHNLRTVVINAGGRVHEVFPGNEWTVDELVKSLIAAAGER